MTKLQELDKLETEYFMMFKDIAVPFPPYWDISEDVKTKIETLKTAIKENKLIVEVTTFFTEGVFSNETNSM